MPTYRDGNVFTHCPDCGALATFSFRNDRGGEHGFISRDRRHELDGTGFARYLYRLMSCGGCGRGGLAVIHDNGQIFDGTLGEFYPSSIEKLPVPADVPEGILKEFREAELCAAHGAYRAASAMLRSVLEKTLKANGYKERDLKQSIEKAAAEKMLSETRKNRAHENRELGNDVVHDDWREVVPDEYQSAHKYAQRILEDFYDDRVTVEAQLRALKRIT